jgi:DNA mismatch repair protein MutS
MKTGSHTSIFKEYCSYLQTYKDKYGEHTVVLMQVGSFYEVYAILNESEQLGEVNIYHICQNIMNIVVTTKVNQVLMSGFQMPYSDKFIKLLIQDGYTVVLVEQTSEGPGAERELKKIISPGTYMGYSDTTTGHIMSVYIEQISHSFVGVGVSIMDVTTGNNYVYHIGENLDPTFWKDEISRLIHYYSPSEFLFQTQNYELTEQDIINFWDIQSVILQLNHYKESSYQSLDFQNQLFHTVFRFESVLSPIEELDMVHTHEMRHSYVYLLQYIYEHTHEILHNMPPPQKINDIHHLSLTSNSVRQLNVIQNYSYYKGKNESLYSIMDECGFIGGKRLLKERLLYPSVDPGVLQLRYDRLEACMTNDAFLELKVDLRKLTDTERSLRRMSLGTLSADQFVSTKLSYDFILRIIDTFQGVVGLPELYAEYADDIIQFKQFHTNISSIFHFENFTTTDKSYFQRGVYPDIDTLSDEIEGTHDHLQSIGTCLSNLIDPSKSCCKFDRNDKYGYFLYCTKNRSSTLTNKCKTAPDHMIHIRDDHQNTLYKIPSKDISFSKKDNSNVFIESPDIKSLTHTLKANVSKLQERNTMYWKQAMNDMYIEYKDMLVRIHNFVSDLDVTCAGAQVAITNRYCRPELLEADKSCVDARDIRHPIVERISVETEYVTNDVVLGKDDKDGILLFGTNACGKSTLMKAIGLNVILAQAGLYVACSRFQLKPYDQIFTRILNNDNIFRSQSSFAVEMMELRSIFQCADKHSLVLGDELCSGTETLSAISIVSQSLNILSTKLTSYMITSHLHQLTDIPIVRDIPNLDIYHLKITCDGGVLSYDRKLCAGSGPPIYGLKVCEAMGLSDDFMKGANKILNHLTHKKETLMSHKVSQYNPSVLMDECKICKGSAEETHHIKEQSTADSHNMIDHHHKNKTHNLVPLCKTCHSKVTYGGLRIYGWKHTSRGKQLDYEYVTSLPKKSKKYSKEQVDMILSYRDKVDSGCISKITCLNLIDSDHGIRPSMKILNDIFHGIYV